MPWPGSHGGEGLQLLDVDFLERVSEESQTSPFTTGISKVVIFAELLRDMALILNIQFLGHKLYQALKKHIPAQTPNKASGKRFATSVTLRNDYPHLDTDSHITRRISSL